jgi:hypothetical protein
LKIRMMKVKRRSSAILSNAVLVLALVLYG